MNSVQENKNELEAAVRYCESAISRAKATIESMEFRQQAASKAWHEQTGREAALEREVARLRAINAERETMLEERKIQLVEERDRSMRYTKEIEELKSEVSELEQSEHDLKFQYSEAKTNMALMTDELEKLRSEKEASSGTCGCQGYRDLEEDRAILEKNVQYLRDEIAKLNDQVEELGKAYNDEVHETNVWKKAHRELKEVNNLQKEQIEMFQRKMSRMNEVSNRSILDRE